MFEIKRHSLRYIAASFNRLCRAHMGPKSHDFATQLAFNAPVEKFQRDDLCNFACRSADG